MRRMIKKISPLLCVAAAGAVAINVVIFNQPLQSLVNASGTTYTMTLDANDRQYYPMINFSDTVASCTFPTALGNPIGMTFSTTVWNSSQAFCSGLSNSDPVKTSYLQSTTPLNGITSIYLEVIKYDSADDDLNPPSVTIADYANFSGAITPTIDYSTIGTKNGWGVSRTFGDEATVWGGTITVTDLLASYFRINFNNADHRWYVLTMTISYSCMDAHPQEASSTEGVTEATETVPGETVILSTSTTINVNT